MRRVPDPILLCVYVLSQSASRGSPIFYEWITPQGRQGCFTGLPSVREGGGQGPVSKRVIDPQAAVSFGEREHGRLFVGEIWTGAHFIKVC